MKKQKKTTKLILKPRMLYMINDKVCECIGITNSKCALYVQTGGTLVRVLLAKDVVKEYK